METDENTPIQMLPTMRRLVLHRRGQPEISERKWESGITVTWGLTSGVHVQSMVTFVRINKH